jgi:hypothetical protein
VPTPAEEAFAARVAELLAEVETLTDEGLERIAKLVEDTRREIASQLASVDPDSFTAAHLQTLRARLRAAIASLLDDYGDEVDDLLTQGAALGAELGGLAGGATEAAVPRGLLAVLQNYSATLITGLGDYARKRIDVVIAQATLGSLTPHAAIRRIAGELPARSVFRSLHSRAEAIVRTEVNRAFSVATQARMTEVAEGAPGLKKKWLTAGDTRVRRTHAEVSGTIVLATESFSVNGYAAMYPRDPVLPAKETVNCRCHAVPVVDEEVLAAVGVTAEA